MITLDGCDNLGKTTFAHEVVVYARKHFPIPAYYQHMGRPGPAFNFGSHYDLMMAPFAVWDRFHVGALLWHEGAMTDDSLAATERSLRRFGNVTILFGCTDRALYKDRLIAASGNRAELFSWDKILDANDRLLELRTKVRHDYFFDPLVDGWPTEETVAAIATLWHNRLKERLWIQ